MDEFFGGLVCATAFFVGLLTLVPVSDGVRQEDYTRSVKVCEVHDGVKYVYRPNYHSGEYVTLCNDGVKITQLTFQD